MRIGRKVVLFVFVVSLAAGFTQAQDKFANIETEVAQTLLKKDLRQAISEAENGSPNDLTVLLRRLSLYRRAADAEKMARTMRQIMSRDDWRKNYSQIGDALQTALRSENFQDAETFRMYLQTFGLNDFAYGKFIEICSKNRTNCDIAGFDAWLAEKSNENTDADKFEWTYRQIGWREKFGLDAAQLTDRFAEDVRKNPADLETALRYLKVFRNPNDLQRLAETFSSAQAYDYYELGEQLKNSTGTLSPSNEDTPAIRRVAVQLLLKSLATPFSEKDAALIYQYHLRYVSIPVKIKNPEKQLRFWTKTALAETYKNLGEAQNAQPIIEELTKLDKSDILDGNPALLSGAVQAQSGARTVEADILQRQAAGQNSYEYWNERVRYYHGRKEPEQIFSAYLQAFAAVPFDLAKDGVRSERIFQIRLFADFVRHNFGDYGGKSESADWSESEKRNYQFWLGAENFLRNEFGKTNANIQYSNRLTQIIAENNFKNLTDEILRENPEILTRAAQSDRENFSGGMVNIFLRNEKIPQAKKDAVYEQLLKIADGADVKSAWILFGELAATETNIYSARLTPLVEKHFAESIKFAKNYHKADQDDGDFSGLPLRYGAILFRVYLGGEQSSGGGKTDGRKILSAG